MKIDKRKIEFNDRGEDISITLNITPDEHDFWTIAKGYKVHYCLDYNSICVYRDDDTTYKTIYKTEIK